MKRKEIYLAVLIFLPLVACAPASKYRLLSFFFDGVPEPHSDTAVVAGVDLPMILDISQHDSAQVINQTAYFVHEPYRKKECGSCHDQNDVGSLVKLEPALCYMCHDDFNTKFTSLHGPVDGGYCSTCHLPHMSKNEHLLVGPDNDLCFPCHVKEEVERPKAHVDIGDDLCIKCHDPHGTNNPHRLKNMIPLER